MSTAEMIERMQKPHRAFQTRLVGVYYLITILTGAFLLLFQGKLAFAADLLAGIFYIAITALLYAVCKPGKK